MSKEQIEEQVLHFVANNSINSTRSWSAENNFDHDAVLGVVRSLVADEIVNWTTSESQVWQLTQEGAEYNDKGSPEAQVFYAVPAEGIPNKDLPTKVGKNLHKIGFQQCMKRGWLKIDAGTVVRKVDSIEDTTQVALKQVNDGGVPDSIDDLKKRKLVLMTKVKDYTVEKGAQFTTQRKKAATDLTVEMLQTGSWKTETFKPYNFQAIGKNPNGGHLHPLLKVREEFRMILLEMGFEEMPTNNFVESSFWNFDTLFQPQSHPARDMHDTFFVSDPAKSTEFPEGYLERVKEMHEKGGNGSLGWGYDWKIEEAQKNLLRTHTTAVSARMLYKLAQDFKNDTNPDKEFKAKRYFSIDRVFRNEALDATHLAEFHQVEGVVAQRGATLGDLIGVIAQFFKRLGMTDLAFKPTYNPYTEPSMEIFAHHPQLGKQVEVGNSGVFRPEMLLPMGLPEDVGVIAWGLSLERPTMILYQCDNIRDLFGHKVDVEGEKNNPLVRF